MCGGVRICGGRPTTTLIIIIVVVVVVVVFLCKWYCITTTTIRTGISIIETPISSPITQATTTRTNQLAIPNRNNHVSEGSSRHLQQS
jgi:hypothetical protein